MYLIDNANWRRDGGLALHLDWGEVTPRRLRRRSVAAREQAARLALGQGLGTDQA